MIETFWLVWNPQGKYPPAQRHHSIDSAKTEAERLARCNPGAEFFVLRACARARKVDVEWVPLDEDKRLPNSYGESPNF